MIDCHCHILPGIDDGAGDLNQAMDMARVAVDSGVTDILLTPHHNDGMYFNLREDIVRAVDTFQRILKNVDIDLRVHPGAECHVTPELPEHLQSGIACTYANRRQAVLLELPKHTLPNGSEAIIEQVAYLGLIPVIAHPERNSVLSQDPKRMQDWFERGWKFQLTNQSCSGQFGEAIQDTCYDWLARGWIHFIASDAHRSTGRSPDMRKGVAQIAEWFGEEAALLLSTENPGRLLRGEAIADMPTSPTRRKRQGFRLW